MHCIEFENCRDSCEEVVLWFLREYLPNEFFFLVVEEKDLSEEGVDGWVYVRLKMSSQYK